MLVHLLWSLSIRTRRFLRTWAPTNILLDWFRDHRWSGVVALIVPLGAGYLADAWLVTAVVDQGWPEWLYLLFFLFLWNAGKFLLFLPVEAIRELAHSLRRAAGAARAHRERSHTAPRSAQPGRAHAAPWGGG